LEAHQAQLLLAAGNPDTEAAPVWRKVAFLEEFIRARPTSSRWRLSRQLCEALGWKQANGALRDMVCRGLLLMLERAGQIELPPVRRHIRGQCRIGRPRPEAVLIDTTPLAAPFEEVGPIEIQQVQRTADEPLFNSLMESHHYLGYEQPVGEHLKYLVWMQGRPVACLAWSSAPRHLGSRDRFIGWSGEARRRNIRFIAYDKVPRAKSLQLGAPLPVRESCSARVRKIWSCHDLRWRLKATQKQHHGDVVLQQESSQRAQQGESFACVRNNP